MESNHSIEDQFSEFADEFDKNLTLDEEQQEPPQEVEEEEEEEDEDDDDDDDESDDGEFEFFIGGGDPHSPVSAEEIFQNGQIRPIFPFSGENSDEATTSYGPPVKKLFVVSSPERDDVAEGPYCAWSSTAAAKQSPAETPAPAPEMSQKSNSTGFSKLWKVRDLLVRSHSDGKDAFVFLKGEAETASSIGDKMKMKMKMKKKKVNVANIEVAKGDTTTTSNSGKKKGKGKPKSAYEVLYGKREKKTGKSYLPYRQDLVGFFTNASGMSRNVHPY